MVILGLLAVALVLLCLGVASSSPMWLAGSLAASVAAAVLLYRSRNGPRVDGTQGTDPMVSVVDGRPRYHRPDCALVTAAAVEQVPRRQAVDDGFMPCSLCEPDAVRRGVEAAHG